VLVLQQPLHCYILLQVGLIDSRIYIKARETAGYRDQLLQAVVNAQLPRDEPETVVMAEERQLLCAPYGRPLLALKGPRAIGLAGRLPRHIYVAVPRVAGRIVCARARGAEIEIREGIGVEGACSEYLYVLVG